MASVPYPLDSPASHKKRQAMLARVNESAGPYGTARFEYAVPFGPALVVESYVLANGLRVLICEDSSAPVIAYHTWYRVGSRHEKPGKTGLAHLFEHLMFNETENLKAGEFDRRLERAGAESNAATWLDWTQYNISVPRDQLGLVVALEAERMAHLVLREPQVASEKDVVANERRYRVDDDVEGAVSEILWATAFSEHAYRWPTIGWMEDILNFTTGDCLEFYETFYSPNNAEVIVVGATTARQVLSHVVKAYGGLPAATLPIEDVHPEPPQTAERRIETSKPTATEKVVIGYHGPALGDIEHAAASLLTEILFGGRASRVHRLLVRERELAIDVSAFVGPFRDPGLIEIYAVAREGRRAEELLEVIDREIERLNTDGVTIAEIERARARLELGVLSGLESVDGKASTIGFYDTVIGRPAGAFERLDLVRSLGRSDVLRAGRRFLRADSRSVVLVRPQGSEGDA